MLTLAEILWVVIIGLLVGGLLQQVLSPSAKIYDPYGTLLVAILGALALAWITPGLGLFAASFVFTGILLMALLGAILAVWLVAAVMVAIFSSGKDKDKGPSQQDRRFSRI